MEDIHGVDVSWLHQTNRDRSHRHHVATPPNHSHDLHPPHSRAYEHHNTLRNGDVAPTPHTPPVHVNGTPLSPPPQPFPTPAKTPPKRPGLLHRGSSEKVQQPQGEGPKSTPRRPSWISNISSKFSSSPQSQVTGPGSKAQTNGTPPHGTNGTAPPAPERPPPLHRGSSETLEPYVPQTPKSAGSSFFSNALRRLSAGSQTGMGKAAGSGGVCPRKVMNVDPNRPRCLVPELDQNKLRRVAFCVDVEIASGPRYNDDTDPAERKRKFKEKKLKEKGEGEALKHPHAVAEQKDNAGVIQASCEAVGTEAEPNPEGTILEGKKETSRKKEKKKKSEEERKARKEEKRRKAELNGDIPVQIHREDESGATDTSTSTSPPGPSAASTPRHTDRPTTDPLRIYRRCCQLRETPVLKRISEQLGAPTNCIAATPGTVSCLDLTGSRLQFPDIVTLSDWLAVVPVRKLLLEDADLTDEGVRVVLAGLLAAKSSEYPRHRPHHRANGTAEKREERSGVVEKLVLKNNPKITKEGWKHISLFIYMCKSLRALDVSMVIFPPIQPPYVPPTPSPTEGTPGTACPPPSGAESPDMADIFSKSISERLGGSVLEELILAECSLTTQHVRKIVDSIIISGLKRLSLAGNNINNESLDHVIRYVRSGVCQGLDLGGNDLRDRLERLCSAFQKDSRLWALSLADCNLTPHSLKPLFPALLRLTNFRFLDLSHNHELFEQHPSAAALLRKYLPMLPILKRLHLINVSMSPSQAIAIAEILPECPQLAHISILENPQLSALAAATSEEAQEDACALYASLMVACRVSHTLIAIDVDVPTRENSEIVQALGKQVVAYCLRNMEFCTQLDNPDTVGPDAAAARGVKPKAVEIPEVLLHLVGNSEGQSDPHPEISATDNDYIVGGTGVVKALNYCLTQKEKELRRRSLPTSGTVTPRDHLMAPDIGAAKAKSMSKDLLESAKKIRERIRPSMARTAQAGDDMAYRRLLFLDNTLQGIIQRFEAEYPECRAAEAPTTPAKEAADTASTTSSLTGTSPPSTTYPATDVTSITSPGSLDDHEDLTDDDQFAPRIRSRHNSDVSLAAKALSIEEGQVHRLRQKMKHDLWPSHGGVAGAPPSEDEPEHLKVLREKLEALDADELRECLRRDGVEGVLRYLGEKAEYFRGMAAERPGELEELRKMLRTRIHKGEGAEGMMARSAVEDEE